MICRLYFLMQILSSYRSYLKGMDQDGLFSRFGLPDRHRLHAALPNNQYGHARVVQGGRYARRNRGTGMMLSMRWKANLCGDAPVAFCAKPTPASKL